ncbi:DUF1566 domain-containing protein [Crocinitomicaceae bacterium]|nr:DUF1566 domain-containing protein [Crocinitomicaceae bacterium]
MKKLLLFGALALSINAFGQSTVKIGNLEVMTEDLGSGTWDQAVKACADLGDGWRLPTKDELNVLYKNKDKIGGFMDFFYWSSKERDIYDRRYVQERWSEGYGLDFGNGNHSYSKKNQVYWYVRAVRSLTRKQIAEEKRQTEKIKSLCAEINPLIEKDILAAASKFDSNNDLLLSSDLATSTLNNLKSALSEYYENKSINIDDKITESVIEKNKTLLALLVNGNYEVGVNNYKNITKPEAFEGFKVDIPPSLIEGACCGVQKPYNFDIETTSKDSILVSTKYYSSSKKPIYRKDDKTFYFKTKTGLSSIEFILDSSLPKGEIKIDKLYKTVKYANDIIIEEKTYDDIKKRGITKKE